VDAIYFDVRADDSRLKEMLELTHGARKVPVIVTGGKVAIGYGGT